MRAMGEKLAGSHESASLLHHRPSFRQALLSGLLAVPVIVVAASALWPLPTTDFPALLAQFAFATVGFAAAMALGELAYHAVDRIRST